MTTEYHRFDAIAKSSVTYDILFCYVAAYLYAEREADVVERRRQHADSDAYCKMSVEFITARYNERRTRICNASRCFGV